MKQTVSGNIKCFDIFCNDEAIEKSMNRKSILDTILEEKDKQLEHLQNLIDKTTNYYLKTLAKNGSMPDEAVEMFNLLEGNK